MTHRLPNAGLVSSRASEPGHVSTSMHALLQRTPATPSNPVETPFTPRDWGGLNCRLNKLNWMHPPPTLASSHPPLHRHGLLGILATEEKVPQAQQRIPSNWNPTTLNFNPSRGSGYFTGVADGLAQRGIHVNTQGGLSAGRTLFRNSREETVEQGTSLMVIAQRVHCRFYIDTPRLMIRLAQNEGVVLCRRCKKPHYLEHAQHHLRAQCCSVGCPVAGAWTTSNWMMERNQLARRMVRSVFTAFSWVEELTGQTDDYGTRQRKFAAFSPLMSKR